MSISRHLRGRIPTRHLPTLPSLTSLLRRVLKSERVRWTGDLNIIFVDDTEIRRLNRRFLQESGTTDVIAFRYKRPPQSPTREDSADVYVCVTEAVRNAKTFDVPENEEVRRLVIHGTLHLLGYDDHKRKDRDRMWKVQEKFVNLWRKQT